MLARFLISKYLRFDKTQPFISITAILAFLGVGVGIMVLIVAMAIMEGMIKHFEEKLFVMNYPITLFATHKDSVNQKLLEKLESKFPNLKFSPYVRSQGAIKIGQKLNAGLVYGVSWQKEMQINKILSQNNTNRILTQNSIILGKRALKDTNLALDSKVTLILTQLQASGISLTPQMKRFNIDGTFDSGLHSYDEGYMYVDIKILQKLKGLNDDIYDGIHIYSSDPMNEIEIIKEYLPNGVSAIGWWQQNGNFFNAIAMEKRALFIVLMLIILMASLNIISSLMMVIMTRRREIALLLSLGTNKKEIFKTFFWLGNVIGFSGMIFGAILAMILLAILHTFPIISLPADVYGSSKLPLYLSFFDLLSIFIGGIIIVVASSYYPAKKASKINPLNTLRNE